MSFGKPSPWTPGVVKQFLILLDVHPKLAYAAIAVRLNEACGVVLTKNSCIGYARRNGMAPRQRAPLPRVPQVRLSPPLRMAPPPPPQPKPKRIGKVDLMDLSLRDCRWPEGDEAPFLFCGAPIAFDGCSYCLPHARRAYPAVARAT